MSAGWAQAMIAVPSERETLTFVGAEGGFGRGVTATRGADDGPVPSAFAATTST